MSDLALILQYIPLALLSVYTIIVSLRRRTNHFTRYIVFLSSMLLCWILLVILFNCTSSYALSAFLYDLNLPFVALASLAVLLLFMRVYGLKGYLTPAFIAALCVIPAVTALLSLTMEYHSFLRVGLRVVSTTPQHQLVGERGVWFWVHALHCYGMILAAFLIVLIQHRRVPSIYRGASRLLMAGILITVCSNLLVVLRLTGSRLDYSLIGGSIGAFIFCISVRDTQAIDFLNHVRDTIFHELEEAVLLLDNEDHIISRNLSAKYILFEIGCDLEERSYANFLATLESRSFRSAEPILKESGVDFFIHRPAEIQVLNVQTRVIADKRGQKRGSIILVTDVSDPYRAIRQLEAEAGIDALTGLMTPLSIESVQWDMENQGIASVTAIAASIDRLREIIDTLGSLQADFYLRTAADILQDCIPPRGFVARTGGNLFLLLIPSFAERQVEELLEAIAKRLSEAPLPHGGSSMSFGWRVGGRDRPLAKTVSDAYAQLEGKHREAEAARSYHL